MQQMIGMGLKGRVPREWRTVVAAVKQQYYTVIPAMMEGSFDEVLLAQVSL